MSQSQLQIDAKEQQILEHYKMLIETSMFNEYDILGFLIFIRRHLNDNEHRNVKEFAHLVAHRERNQGKVNNCIITAIKNNYQIEQNGKTITGYRGMEYNEWVEEWKNIGERMNIAINECVIKDLTLCAFSLAQFARYKDKGNRGSGELELFISNDGSLALVTTEGNADSPYICYSKFGKFTPCREISAGYLRNPVEAIRVNGKLRLKDSDGYII